MNNLEHFDADGVANADSNIFGLPFTEDEARLVLLPVPWEVTVSYGAGTARAPEKIMEASRQVDLFYPDDPDAWKQGMFMREMDSKILDKSDRTRVLAEHYIDYLTKNGDKNLRNSMVEQLRNINEEGRLLNEWVYNQASEILKKGKLVALVGGDHSTPLGYWKALAEHHGQFSILQIDAHCDLRDAYEDFTYSHASITFNGLKEIGEITRVVQVGLRDFSRGEWDYISESGGRVVAFTDQAIKKKMLEGEPWKAVCDEMVANLGDKVHISYDIDGLDPALCPNTGTPVPGGLQTEQVHYLFNKIAESGRQMIGFDLVEVGVSPDEWDANVGARELWKLCNLLISSNT